MLNKVKIEKAIEYAESCVKANEKEEDQYLPAKEFLDTVLELLHDRLALENYTMPTPAEIEPKLEKYYQDMKKYVEDLKKEKHSAN